MVYAEAMINQAIESLCQNVSDYDSLEDHETFFYSLLAMALGATAIRMIEVFL